MLFGGVWPSSHSSLPFTRPSPQSTSFVLVGTDHPELVKQGLAAEGIHALTRAEIETARLIAIGVDPAIAVVAGLMLVAGVVEANGIEAWQTVVTKRFAQFDGRAEFLSLVDKVDRLAVGHENTDRTPAFHAIEVACPCLEHRQCGLRLTCARSVDLGRVRQQHQRGDREHSGKQATKRHRI